MVGDVQNASVPLIDLVLSRVHVGGDTELGVLSGAFVAVGRAKVEHMDNARKL